MRVLFVAIALVLAVEASICKNDEAKYLDLVSHIHAHLANTTQPLYQHSTPHKRRKKELQLKHVNTIQYYYILVFVTSFSKIHNLKSESYILSSGRYALHC